MKRDGATFDQITDDVLAAKLLIYGDECMGDGCSSSQAEGLFRQAWSLAANHNQAIADAAAWRIGWILLQRQEYAEASAWFQHIREYPAQTASIWRILHPCLESLCTIALSADRLSHTAAPNSQNGYASGQLTIYTLGRFEVLRDKGVVPLSTAHKSSVIVRYLLTRPHYSASKDELMELLWPNTPSSKATHNLHVAINTVRRAVDIGSHHYVLYDGGQYRLNPETPPIYDCSEFRKLVAHAEQYRLCGSIERAAEAYRQSLSLYKGDFYVGRGDGLWAMAERERLLTQYLRALDQLGALCMEQRLFEAAIDVYQRLIERDEYREDGYYHLMQCYWKLGRRKAALQQYEQCAALLDRDLGLKPIERLTSLYEEMLESTNKLGLSDHG